MWQGGSLERKLGEKGERDTESKRSPLDSMEQEQEHVAERRHPEDRLMEQKPSRRYQIGQ